MIERKTVVAARSEEVAMVRVVGVPSAFIAVFAAAAMSAGCSRKEVAETAKAVVVTVDPARLALFQPLPAEMASEENPLTDAKVKLGRLLYFDPRLSRGHDLSCNSCHGLDTFGADNKRVSTGHRGQLGKRNSPTVYNAAMHVAQFWDGRAATIEEQAKGPILNPVEMAMPDEGRVLTTLRSIPEYVALFAEAFPGEAQPVSYDNLARAIGAFERRLVTPSRWDRFLQGEQEALTTEEKAGFNAFLDAGCATCHFGANLGGHMFQKLGLVAAWTKDDDLGRFEVTQAETDRLVFKVPGLRNVAKTGPWFHDGAVERLDEAVILMARHQVGRELDKGQVASIVKFLDALTGELPLDYIRAPELPPSTAATPKPDPT